MQEDSVDLEAARATLKQAHNLLRYFDPSTAGVWPRAVALLTRQALESGLQSFWLAIAPAVSSCSSRAQLLSLTEFVEEEQAEAARQTWNVLSRACHHHPYELAPTSTELQSWIEEVEGFLDAVDRVKN